MVVCCRWVWADADADDDVGSRPGRDFNADDNSNCNSSQRTVSRAACSGWERGIRRVVSRTRVHVSGFSTLVYICTSIRRTLLRIDTDHSLDYINRHTEIQTDIHSRPWNTPSSPIPLLLIAMTHRIRRRYANNHCQCRVTWTQHPVERNGRSYNTMPSRNQICICSVVGG